MNEYEVIIDAKWDIGQITLQIKNEEVAASEFIANQVVEKGNQKINVTKFRELKPGEIPNDFELQIGSPEDPPPNGFSIVWNGQFMIENKPTLVTFYRHK